MNTVNLAWILPSTLLGGYLLGLWVQERHTKSWLAHREAVQRAEWEAAVKAKRKRDNDRRRQRRIDRARDDLDRG